MPGLFTRLSRRRKEPNTSSEIQEYSHRLDKARQYGSVDCVNVVNSQSIDTLKRRSKKAMKDTISHRFGGSIADLYMHGNDTIIDGYSTGETENVYADLSYCTLPKKSGKVRLEKVYSCSVLGLDHGCDTWDQSRCPREKTNSWSKLKMKLYGKLGRGTKKLKKNTSKFYNEPIYANTSTVLEEETETTGNVMESLYANHSVYSVKDTSSYCQSHNNPCTDRNNDNSEPTTRETCSGSIPGLDVIIDDMSLSVQCEFLSVVSLVSKVQKEPAWQENGTAFIQSVTRLLERLLDYRNVLEGDENREKRMTCTVNLLNFYKNEINRQEMYIRYIYKLRELHLACGNHTEAGFTQLLHAELLDWHAHGAEKEKLYGQCIEHFDKGKSWEYGMPLLKSLADYYEKKVRYKNLSSILTRRAEFYNNILNVTNNPSKYRPDPEYFRVGFYGQGFPLFLRNKEFIYRGNECEKLSDFQQRLQSEFTGATILSNSGSPSDNIKNGEGQCLQIFSVKPIPEIDKRFLDYSVPDSVRSFYRVNRVKEFQFDKPFHRGAKDKENEHKSLWIERISYQTTSELPGILRWFEVSHSHTVQLSPIEVAIDTMNRKTHELKELVNKYRYHSGEQLNPFTMLLNGMIDAAVSGGIRMYQEAFFSDEYIRDFPEYSDYIPQLKSALLEQIGVLDEGLRIHGDLVTESMRPLQHKMEEMFARMKSGIGISGSPNMSRIEQEMIDRRLSMQSMSSKSISPAGSNRSSGVFSESFNEVSETSTEDISETQGSRTEELKNSSDPALNGQSSAVDSDHEYKEVPVPETMTRRPPTHPGTKKNPKREQSFISYLPSASIAEDDLLLHKQVSPVSPPTSIAPPRPSAPPIPPKRCTSTPGTPSGYTSPPSRKAGSNPTTPSGTTPSGDGLGVPLACSSPGGAPAVPPRSTSAVKPGNPHTRRHDPLPPLPNTKM